MNCGARLTSSVLQVDGRIEGDHPVLAEKLRLAKGVELSDVRDNVRHASISPDLRCDPEESAHDFRQEQGRDAGFASIEVTD